MPTVKFNAARGELCIRLEGATEGESYQTFLALGGFLRQFGEKRCACLGHRIVEELTSKKHDSLNVAGVQPTLCIFCVIAEKQHEASKTSGEPLTACPF